MGIKPKKQKKKKTGDKLADQFRPRSAKLNWEKYRVE